MSEYYAEHESIAEVGDQLKAGESRMESGADQIEVSRKALVRSISLEGLGYGWLVDRTKTGVSKLAKKEKQIASVLNTVSSLYADYESKVISALDESTSGGNNFSRDSLHQTRDAKESHPASQYGGSANAPSGSEIAASGFIAGGVIVGGASSVINGGVGNGGTVPGALQPGTLRPGTPPADNSITDYINPTPEQKRLYVHDWLEKTHPELLEQIYDRLHGKTAVATGVGGIAAQAVSATGYGAGRISAQGAGGTTYSNDGIKAYTNPTSGDAVRGAVSETARGTSATTANGGATAPNTSAGNVDGAAAVGGAAGDAGDAGHVGESGVGDDGVSGGAGAAGMGGATDAGGAGVAGMGDDSDWVADMLNDAVDSDAAQAAQGAIGKAATTANPAASATGPATLADSAAMGFATDEQSGFSQLMADLGGKFVGAVQKYGLQAGILVGGAGAAYASSGVAIESVAHCAEFVSTKCIPGVQGFMEQAGNVAHVVRVSIRMTLGNIMQGVNGLGS